MFGHFNFLEVINLEALIKRAGYRRSGRFKHTDGFRWKLPFSSKSDRRLSALNWHCYIDDYFAFSCISSFSIDVNTSKNSGTSPKIMPLMA